MRQLVEPHLEKIDVYVPGLSIKAMQKKYGIDNFVKLASNECAFGPSPLALEAAHRALQDAHRYPNEVRNDLKERICAYLGVPGIEPRHVVLGNGSNEIITLMSRSFLAREEMLLNAWPSFMVYRLSAAAMNRAELTVPLTSELDYDLEGMSLLANGPHKDRIKLVFIGNPNNPTGQYLSAFALGKFIESLHPQVIVVIDEAYFEYVQREDYSSSVAWVLRRPRTAVLRTFSKIFGLAGLRLGYAVCDPDIAQVLHRVRDPFNVNSVAQEAAIAALSDASHIEKGRCTNLSEIQRIKKAISGFGLWTSASVGNFVLMRLPETIPNSMVGLEEFLKRGVIVRPVSGYDLPRYLRVTIGQPHENDIFISALSDILNHF